MGLCDGLQVILPNPKLDTPIFKPQTPNPTLQTPNPKPQTQHSKAGELCVDACEEGAGGGVVVVDTRGKLVFLNR